MVSRGSDTQTSDEPKCKTCTETQALHPNLPSAFLASPYDFLPNAASMNQPQTEADLEVVRRSVNRGYPYGPPAWQQRVARRLQVGHTLRRPGRPKKKPELPCSILEKRAASRMALPSATTCLI